MKTFIIKSMVDYSLPGQEIAKLLAAHRDTRDKRVADRINAVVLLASGRAAEDVADALLVDPNTVGNHFERYRQKGLAGLRHLAYRGSGCELDEGALAVVEGHVQPELYLSAEDVAAWVQETFGIAYTVSGMTALRHRLGFVYKKPKLIPGKADHAAHEAFLAQYEALKQHKGENDVIPFMDAVHPQHNPVLGYGWIKRGEDREVPSNTGRRRVNINCAVDLERLEPLMRYDDTIDASSTLALFDQILLTYTCATCLYIICENARYDRSRAVQTYLQDSCIKLVFLPAYAPNLNLIERLWQFLKKQVLYNRYYETFADFGTTCEEFFNNFQQSPVLSGSPAVTVDGELRHYRPIRITEKLAFVGHISWATECALGSSRYEPIISHAATTNRSQASQEHCNEPRKHCR